MGACAYFWEPTAEFRAAAHGNRLDGEKRRGGYDSLDGKYGTGRENGGRN
jgi:hypothetical protein